MTVNRTSTQALSTLPPHIPFDIPTPAVAFQLDPIDEIFTPNSYPMYFEGPKDDSSVGMNLEEIPFPIFSCKKSDGTIEYFVKYEIHMKLNEGETTDNASFRIYKDPKSGDWVGRGDIWAFSDVLLDIKDYNLELNNVQQRDWLRTLIKFHTVGKFPDCNYFPMQDGEITYTLWKPAKPPSWCVIL